MTLEEMPEYTFATIEDGTVLFKPRGIPRIFNAITMKSLDLPGDTIVQILPGKDYVRTLEYRQRWAETL